MMSKVLCTICARGNSVGVKGKNIRLLEGKPLIAHTIEQAIHSNLFDHIVISTDSDAIVQISVQYGAEVFFQRDSVLSSCEAGKIDAIKDAFVRSEAYYDTSFDYLVDLDATSPLRDVNDIKQSFTMFLENKYTNLITACPAKKNPYFNIVEVDDSQMVRLSKKLKEQIVRRQSAPKCYDMNASIYIWTRSAILNDVQLFNPNTGLYIMPEERSVDIDSELDFKLVELIMQERKIRASIENTAIV